MTEKWWQVRKAPAIVNIVLYSDFRVRASVSLIEGGPTFSLSFFCMFKGGAEAYVEKYSS